MFLKEINGFTYDNSENLGNAFELLLSIMGSQGDAGMFRTPRHIIDFIVDAVDPQKNEQICDPACGSAGFLISAYNHILKTNTKDKRGDLLSPEEKKKLIKNFVGYDISPDMVRLSKVNLYLHGFPSPTIFEYDTLSSEEKWDENFDIMLANPPFMSPRGGIRPHKRFSVQANRSEVLFVDYILEHLRPKGRAGIIVPEGIVFLSAIANQQLRKLLIEDGLFAVVSLPVGIFNPYSATIKTSVIFFDIERAKKNDEILFIRVENDGFDLGAQRFKIDKNDLPEALKIIQNWQEGKKSKSKLAKWVGKKEINKSGDYSLNPSRYDAVADYSNAKWPIVALKDICEIRTGKKNVNQGNPNGKYPFFTCANEHTYSDSYSFDTEAVLVAGNGDVGTVKYYKGKFEAYQRTYILSNFKNSLAKYVFFVLRDFLKEAVIKQKLGNTMAYIKLGALQNYQMPLPPIKIQEKIIKEIKDQENIIKKLETSVHDNKQKIKEKIRGVWGV